jgi:hypothetical protein
MPGTGKSTFIKALLAVLQMMGKKVLAIQVKDCSEGYTEIMIPEEEVLMHISGILQFTASDGFKVSFDRLAFTSCSSIDCLIEYVEKRYKPDIADWIVPRLLALKRFVEKDRVKIPTCLKRTDELVRRTVVGILYAIRPYFTYPVVLDDALSFVVNEAYRESFMAMMRPYLISLNRYLLTGDLLTFNPIIVTPGGAAGIYKIAHPYHYVVIFDSNKWTIPREEIEKIASYYS